MVKDRESNEMERKLRRRSGLSRSRGTLNKHWPAPTAVATGSECNEPDRATMRLLKLPSSLSLSLSSTSNATATRMEGKEKGRHATILFGDEARISRGDTASQSDLNGGSDNFLYFSCGGGGVTEVWRVCIDERSAGSGGRSDASGGRAEERDGVADGNAVVIRTKRREIQETSAPSRIGGLRASLIRCVGIRDRQEQAHAGKSGPQHATAPLRADLAGLRVAKGV